MTRRIVMQGLLGLTVFSAAFGMAATLGGVGSAKLGADDGPVAACDTDGVTTAYASSWDATDKRYEVTSVTVAGVADGCDGLTLKVTVTDSTGAALTEGTLTVPVSTATSHTVSLATPPASKAVTGVHVTIA